MLQSRVPTGFSITDNLSINSAGIATCAGRSFTGIKTDTIVRYQLTGETTERFNRVIDVDTTGLFIELAAVNNVTGVCNGSLPTGESVSPTFSLGVPNINLNEKKGL